MMICMYACEAATDRPAVPIRQGRALQRGVANLRSLSLIVLVRVAMQGSSISAVRIPGTDQEASTQARQRLGQMLADLGALGVPVEGDLGSAQPVEAMEKVFADHQFDEIIVAALPGPVSRWLRADLPHRAERRFGLPGTTIITKRWP